MCSCAILPSPLPILHVHFINHGICTLIGNLIGRAYEPRSQIIHQHSFSFINATFFDEMIVYTLQTYES